MSNIETQNALTVQSHYATPAVDAFDHDDPGASPIRGLNAKFDNDGAYKVGREKTKLEEDRTYVVLDKAEGWQFLKKDCQPEWRMRTPGEPKPEMPHCPEDSWPLGLDGKPSNPWKWYRFLYLIDSASGESMTFSSNTVGGRIAISELTDQIRQMRFMSPGALPLVQLKSVMMPTDWGKRPRPHFRIVGWKSRDIQPRIEDHADGDPGPMAAPDHPMDDEIEY
jgi:hypothetical protein